MHTARQFNNDDVAQDDFSCCHPSQRNQQQQAVGGDAGHYAPEQ